MAVPGPARFVGMALAARAGEQDPHIFPHGMESIDGLGRIHEGVARLDWHELCTDEQNKARGQSPVFEKTH